MTNTPETDANCWREGTSEWAAANFARKLERERDDARAAFSVATDQLVVAQGQTREWRECAEKLAKVLRKEWKVRALICYGDAHEALAEFDRLKETIK